MRVRHQRRVQRRRAAGSAKRSSKWVKARGGRVLIDKATGAVIWAKPTRTRVTAPRDRKRDGGERPETGPPMEAPALLPSDMFPDRVVYGGELPAADAFPFAHEAGPGGFDLIDPAGFDDEGSAYFDDEGPAYVDEEDEDFEQPDDWGDESELGDVSDYFDMTYWKAKYQEAVGKLQAALSRFMEVKPKLLKVRKRIEAGIAVARKGGNASALQAFQRQLAENDRLLQENAEADKKVADAQARIAALKQQSGGQLGIAPLLIGGIAGAITVLGVAAGRAYQSRNNSIRHETTQAQIEKGLLTPAQAAELERAMTGGGGLLPSFGGGLAAGGTLLLALGAFLFLRGRTAA